MIPDGQAAAALYRSGFINGSETSAGRARAMMQCIVYFHKDQRP